MFLLHNYTGPKIILSYSYSMDSYSMNSNLYLLQSTTVWEHLFCGIRVKLLGCEQCRASFCLCIFSGFDLCFWGLPFVLGFCHSIIAILTCASVNLPSCGVKCWLPWWWWDKRTLFHWHCRGWQGVSKAVAWHAPRVLPLWWCPNGVPGLMLASMVKVGYALRVPLTLHGLALLYLKR